MLLCYTVHVKVAQVKSESKVYCQPLQVDGSMLMVSDLQLLRKRIIMLVADLKVAFSFDVFSSFKFTIYAFTTRIN